MLNKKLLKYILNVKHTIIDDVKMFDDDSIVFYVHPSKVQQCRCGICGRKSPYYDAGRGYRLWRTTDIGLHRAEICADSYRVNALNMVSLLLMFHGLDTNLAIPMTLNIQSLGLQ